ncbi:hypothetical protein [Methylobacterium sp. MA0201]|uniref:hypothetical protein n=1 Tax=Methylobacterium alsaeris TaxID=3344826 RepID=UPI0037564818
MAAPSTGSRSAGTKLVLYPNVSATEADFAVGIEIGAMWHSIPHSGTFYRWYAGSTQRMQLDGNGNLSAAGKITGTGFVSSAGDGATGLSVNVGNGYLSYQTFGASSFIWNYGTALFIGTSSAHSVAIATDNVARMTVAATGDVGMSGNLTVAGRLRPGSFTVATVPAGVAGDLVHVSNARKVGEAAGSGTGVLSYYSNGNWRRLSDDGPVAA